MTSVASNNSQKEMSSVNSSKSNVAVELTDEDYALIFEPEFMAFNKIRTVMCRNSPCTRGNRCSFAHSSSELRRSICMYHFNKGCTKSASFCVHSHKDEDRDKSIIDYKKWKNPSPSVVPKKLTDEELIKEFGEFKIALDDSDSEEDINIMSTSGDSEDEIDKKMVKLVKESAKRPYEVISTTSSSFTPSEEYFKIPGTAPLVPLQECESPNKEAKLTNPFEGTPNSDMYTLIYNQQIMIMNMMSQIQNLNQMVQKLTDLNSKEEKQ